ncbi:MAG TPA: RDD family protein [Pyrinomonadaceae bacterium]|nr:RDD family protein [Pyrinomonadaceae bacterium]
MISDSVRPDLVNKVYPTAKPVKVEAKINSTFSNKDKENKTANQPETSKAKSVSNLISTKLTSPTLVEFHTANATLPEWRLQLQNTVRQRHERTENASENLAVLPSCQPNLVIKGATALKIETVEEVAEPKTAQTGNPKLASALERIKNSRQKFLVEEETTVAPAPAPAKAIKNYPFYIAAKTNDADVKATVNATVKPKLATSLHTKTKDLDTNKPPPLPIPAKIVTNFEDNPAVFVGEEIKVEEKKKVENKFVSTEEIVQTEEPEIEESDDCVPFALRFNAGLFDLIIGSFLSLILLAPFILMSEGWSSFAGIFAFLATCAVIMFVYLTTTVSMYGKTFGMRIFSLELIDVEGEDYPTLHQAAVSSAVYLLSLAFGGIGFLTLPFNEEKRAVHDLVSGTIVVKEE